MRRLSRKKSKRMSLRKKHAVVKNASESKKKLRKEARRMARQGIKRPEPKDPGIPNTCPNKKELLEEMQEQRRIENEHRREVQIRAQKLKNSESFEKVTTVAAFESQNISLESLVTSADVIIEVLDSQDPYPNPALAQLIGEKPLVYLLNKADLVPDEILTPWVSKLSKHHRTFLYNCNDPGAYKEEVLKFLEQFEGLKIGVFGFPNVGKSSFVNSIKGYRIANIGKLPGITKKTEEFLIEKLVFIDTPAVEVADKTPLGALRTATRIESLSDPYTPIMGIFEKVAKEKLLALYGIPDYQDIQEFLTHVSKKLGKVKKGGVPDFDSASKMVLYDWFMHKIPRFTLCS